MVIPKKTADLLEKEEDCVVAKKHQSKKEQPQGRRRGGDGCLQWQTKAEDPKIILHTFPFKP